MEQLANAITFYAFFVASKVAKTGLTVTIDVWELTQAGGATEIVTAGSATEIGDGLYKYVLASGSVDAVGEYIAVFKTADATVDQQHIPALWIVGRGGNENLDAAISSRNATTPPTAAAVATAVRSELATELARVDAPISDLPTNAELASALAAADDAVLAAIADVPTVAEFEARTLPAADYTIVSDLPVAPDNASIAAILVDTGTTLDALIKDVPTVAEFEARTLLAADYTVVSDLPSVPSAASVADAVWDEALAGHTGAGSAGLALSTASSGGVDPSVLADAIWDEALSGHSTAGTTGKKLTDLVNADLSGVATAAALATVDSNVDAILEDTGTTLPAAIANMPTNAELASELAASDDATLAAIAALNNLSSAQAQSAAAAALTAYDPPTKTELDSAVAPLATAAALDTVDDLLDTEVGAIKAVTDKLDTALEPDGAAYRYTANALEQAPSGGSAPTAAAIADAVWDEAIAGHAVVGSTGQALSSAGAAADPLLNPVPGSYASGTAGAALGSLAGASVSIVSPVASDGTTIDLIFGDDYYAADGRALLFNAEGATLTGNPVYLRVRNNVGAVAITGVVTGAHTCYFEVTSAQLSSIGIGEWRYDFEYILPTTHVITVLHDRIMRVKQDAR